MNVEVAHVMYMETGLIMSRILTAQTRAQMSVE